MKYYCFAVILALLVSGSVLQPRAGSTAPVATPVEPLLETLAPFPLQPGATPVASENGRIEIRKRK